MKTIQPFDFSAKEFGDSPKITTFLESCGVADLITTCYGGRNARLSKEFVIQKKSIAVLEAELLNGQKMQGKYNSFLFETIRVFVFLYCNLKSYIPSRLILTPKSK